MTNKSIDDRAEVWAEQHRELYCLKSPTLMAASYHRGATEQKKIDDEQYAKDMRYVNIKKQELIDKFKKAFCKLNCPHLTEYCWQDKEDVPCKEFRSLIKLIEE